MIKRAVGLSETSLELFTWSARKRLRTPFFSRAEVRCGMVIAVVDVEYVLWRRGARLGKPGGASSVRAQGQRA